MLRPALLLAAVLAATTLAGCTLVFPALTSSGDASQARIADAQRYTLARAPADRAPVLVILDDGSDVTGLWRGTGPDGQLQIATRDSVRTVDPARVVQIRGAARRGGGILAAFTADIFTDAILFLALFRSDS